MLRWWKRRETRGKERWDESVSGSGGGIAHIGAIVIEGSTDNDGDTLKC